MYEELLASMRVCIGSPDGDDKIACVNAIDGRCSYFPACAVDLMTKAADAIEELQKKYDGAVSDNKSLCRQIAELAKERNEAYSKGLLEGGIAQRTEDEKWMPKWIPVSERPPKKDVPVFVYLFGDSPYIAWINREGEWETEEFTIDHDYLLPKAWLSLPEPPKEET